MNDQDKKRGRVLRGVVVSDKMDKTVVVAVTRLKKHPKYKKYYKTTKRYKSHDETNKYQVSDNVLIREIKPISKEKRWEIIGKVN